MGANQDIAGFLLDNPRGRLPVLVGYASTAGLAWLAEHTRNRPVDLLIGDTRRFRFEKADPKERMEALAFLQRPDVTVKNWYQTHENREGESSMHAKTWIVQPSGESAGAILLGSANLTRQGLHKNFEMMAVAADGECNRLRAEAERILSKGWNRKGYLRDLIESEEQTRSQSPRAESQPKSASSDGGREDAPAAPSAEQSCRECQKEGVVRKAAIRGLCREHHRQALQVREELLTD